MGRMGRVEGLGGRSGGEVKFVSAHMPRGNLCAMGMQWISDGCGVGFLGMIYNDF